MFAFLLIVSILFSIDAIIYFLASIGAEMQPRFVFAFLFNGAFAIWSFYNLSHLGH
jgi:hypothetical protein